MTIAAAEIVADGCYLETRSYNTVILSQIATQANILYQFLPANYILDHQMPPNIPSDFSNAFFSNNQNKNNNARKAFRGTESLLTSLEV